ncbi:hypothetical protein Bbelb_364010 [Branchiostoma belcheri]|nr:hypothetical protein Bbelb_364010 [Branchiostoma belcheri]
MASGGVVVNHSTVNRETRVRTRVVPGTCLDMRPDIVPLRKGTLHDFPHSTQTTGTQGHQKREDLLTLIKKSLPQLTMLSFRGTVFFFIVGFAVSTPISKRQAEQSTEEAFSCEGRSPGMYSDHKNCSMYYECVLGHPVYHRACAPGGPVFDEQDQMCDWPENLAPPCGTQRMVTEAPEPFTCEDRAPGLYADLLNCSMYWECVVGHPAYNRPCAPDGLVFNSLLGVCDWPYNVVGTCGTKPESRDTGDAMTGSGNEMDDAGSGDENTEETGEVFSCDGRAEGLYSDPRDCSMYYHCAAGHPPYRRPCAPGGTVFDEQDQICDWPENVAPTCGTETMPPPFTCVDKVPGSYTDPQNCAKFYQCVSGHAEPSHRDCPAGGLVFDAELMICNWPAAVLAPCGYKTE